MKLVISFMAILISYPCFAKTFDRFEGTISLSYSHIFDGTRVVLEDQPFSMHLERDGSEVGLCMIWVAPIAPSLSTGHHCESLNVRHFFYRDGRGRVAYNYHIESIEVFSDKESVVASLGSLLSNSDLEILERHLSDDLVFKASARFDEYWRLNFVSGYDSIRKYQLHSHNPRESMHLVIKLNKYEKNF